MNIGFTCGSFDLLHAGHVLALKEAKANCDYLIVGLQTDPSIDRADKRKPIQTVTERVFQLEACRYVDEVWIYETEGDLYAYLHDNLHKINRRFLGEDWVGKKFTGYDLGMQVQFTSRRHNFSSTSLRERVIAAG